MKKDNLAFIAVIIAFATLLPSFRDPQLRVRELKILTYNVRNCLGTDGITDFNRIAGIIKRINPDLVALQELDSATVRSKGIFVAEKIAGPAGMKLIFGPSISFQGGKYGIGIMAKEKPLSVQIVKLPGREESRSLLVTEFRHYFFCCTHFSLNEEDRMASIEIINRTFDGKSKPVILAGDLNALPGPGVLDTLMNNWVLLSDPLIPTFPATGPLRCIDYILGRKSERHDFQILATGVENESLASDHLPLWSSIVIRSYPQVTRSGK